MIKLKGIEGQINLKKINIQGQIKLRNQKVQKVLIIRSGVGSFGIVDFDNIQKSSTDKFYLIKKILD